MTIDQSTVTPDPLEVDQASVTPGPPPSGIIRRALGDTGVSLARGLIGVPEALVGLADIPTGGRVGKTLENAGVDFKGWEDSYNKYRTPELQAAQKEVSDAKGFLPTIGAALQNPSTIIQNAVESAPAMLMGGGIGRAATGVATKLAPKLAGAFESGILPAAIGEGAVAAGQQAEQTRQETPGGLLTPTQSGLAVTAGAIDAAIARLSGGVAKRLGITDPDVLAAGGPARGANKGMARRVAEGFVSEGFLEELPQSAQEQVLQNIAQNKPWAEGVAEAAAQGALTGGLMGGAVNIGKGKEAPKPEVGGPFHALAAATDPKKAEFYHGILNNPTADEGARTAAIRQVYDAMAKEDPVGANMWALNAGEAARNGMPIQLTDAWAHGMIPELFPHAFPNAGPQPGVGADQEDVQGRFEGEGGGQTPPAAKPVLALPAPAEGAPDVANRVPITEDQLGVGATEAPAGAEARNEALWASRDAAEQARLAASGPLGQAAAAGMQSGAVDIHAQQRAAEVGEPAQAAAAKPEGSPAQLQAQANIASVTRNQPGMPLAQAQDILRVAEQSGTDYTVVPHPAGGYTAIPTHFITPDIAEQHAGLQTRQAAQAPKPSMPLDSPELAHEKAAELTAATGAEHEVVPSPVARGKFVVQEKAVSTEREQAPAVNAPETGTAVPETGTPAADPARNVSETPGELLTRNKITTNAPDGRGIIAIEHGGRALEPRESQAAESLVAHIASAGYSTSGLHGANIIAAEPRMVEGKNAPVNAPMTVFLKSKNLIIRADILRALADGRVSVAEYAPYIYHEQLHLADAHAGKNGELASSTHSAFDIKTNSDGTRTPVGAIMKEAFDAYSDPNTATSEAMHYPLSDWEANHRDMGVGSPQEWSTVLKNEVFAQLGRFHFEHPDLMRQELPQAFQLFEDIKNADDKKPGNSIGRAVQQTLRAHSSVRGAHADDGGANRRGEAERAGDRGAGAGVGQRAVQQHGERREVRESAADGRSKRGDATLSDFSGDKVTGILKKKNWAILTAENPGNKAGTPEKNAKANSRLEADLKKLGLDYQRVKGKYGGPEENSFVVTGITQEQAHELRDKYKQDSVMTREGWEHHDGSVTPAKSVELKGAEDPDFYTQMPDGTKFAADMDFEGRTAPTKLPDTVTQHLTDTEKARMSDGAKAHVANRVKKFIKVFSELPSTNEYLHAALAGRAARGWYARSRQAGEAMYGQDYPRFASLMASLSPQTDVKSNFYNAAKVWSEWNAAGRPVDRDAISKILTRNLTTPEGALAGKEAMQAYVNNALRSLDPKSDRLQLSGPKVESFRQNLVGNLDEVTNDRHNAAFAGIMQSLFGGANAPDLVDANGKTFGVKDFGYIATSARHREAAKALAKVTGEPWAPAEVQETVWSFWKTLYELATQKGQTKSALQLIRDGDLTHEMISAVPDLGKYFDEDQFKGITRGERQGLGGDADKAHALSVSFRATPKETGPVASSPAIERIAKRLDQLIKDRRAAEELTAKQKAEDLANENRGDAYEGDLPAGFDEDDDGIRFVKDSTGNLDVADDRFKKWFGDSKVVDKSGKPLRLFHGTLEDFSKFDVSKAENGSNWGPGIYLTNYSEDASWNYATKQGPDHVSKRDNMYDQRAWQILERESGPLESMPAYGSDEYKRIYNQAREEVDNSYGAHGGAVMPLYAKLTNPFVLGGPRETYVTFRQAQKMFEVIDEDPDTVFNGEEELPASAIEAAIRDAASYFDDGGTVFSQAIKAGGFDGVIDNNVYKKFGTMGNMVPSTVHYIVFDPKRVKSAVGNRGTFSGRTSDIRYVKDDGRLVPERELAPKATTGVAADTEAQFTKSGKVVYDKPKSHLPDWLAAASPDAQAFAKNAGVFVEHKSWKDRWSALKKDMGLKVIQWTVDQYRPVLENISRYSYQLLRMASSSDNGLAAIVQHGHVELTKWGNLKVKEGSLSLKAIMSPLAGEHDRFFAWMAAQRAQELMGEKREHNFTEDQIKAGLKFNEDLTPTDKFKGQGSRKIAYAKAMKEFAALNKSVLDVGEAAGTIDPEARKLYEREFYVNFRREKNGEPEFEPNNIAGMVNTKGIKRLKGGEDVLHDLMANTMANWSSILSGALKNNAAWHTLEEAEAKGIARKATYDEKGSVFVMQDGKQVHWIIEDPLVAQALGSLSAVPFRGPVMEALTKFKHVLTAGVTLSPTFRINNVIRDQIAAVAANPTSFNFTKNLIEGFKYSSRNNPEYGNMLAGGALIRMGQNLGDERGALAKRLITEGIDKEHILDNPNKVAKMFGHAWDWWQETGERSESITRAELYRQNYKRMIEEGHDPDRAHFEASYIARDAMDFGLHGTSAAIRMITQVVPFANARLQGLYKLGRGAHADPQRFAMVMGGVTLATILLSLANRDDKEIQERSEWERDNFWLFRVGGTVFRVPKPFEIGAMATIVDRGLEAALDGMDQTARERFIGRLGPIVGNQLNMNPVPQAVAPLIQLWGNKSWFTGQNIESAREANLSTSERIGKNTTATAQLLGKAGVLSPEQIDFMVNAYLGWAGNHAMMTADLALRPAMGLPAKPAGRIDEVPIVGDFFKKLPGNQSRFTEQYYDHLKEIQQAMGDLRMLQQTGQLEKAAEVMKENKQDIQLHGLYTSTQRALGKLNQRERWLNMRNMEPDQKREELDRLAQMKNQLTSVAEAARARVVNSQ